MPSVFFISWILTGYLDLWRVPYDRSPFLLLLLIPLLIYMIHPGRRLSILSGILMMGFVCSILLGYLYHLNDSQGLPPSGASFLGGGLMILMGSTMAYWLLDQQHSSSTQGNRV